MDRHFLKALLFAWDRAEFRAGLQHLIDLDEVTSLLAALSITDHDHEVELRAMDLLRSGLDTAEIRRAALLLVEDDDVRHNLAAGLAGSIADRPDLARSIRSALEDPQVRAELRDALESAPLRAVIWKVAEHQFRGHRWALIRASVLLVVRHRHARRLVLALRRHGVLRELRRPPAGPQPDPTVHQRGETMRNEAMQRLDGLVGSWRATMRNAWFLEPAGREVPGAATVEWLGDAFVVFRWTMQGDVGPATSEMVLVLGRSDARDAYTALYHDERGVCRSYAMTFGGPHWTLDREDPDMFQRFIATVEPDRIVGRWEASDDHGATWRKDFDLVFDRTPRR